MASILWMWLISLSQCCNCSSDWRTWFPPSRTGIFAAIWPNSNTNYLLGGGLGLVLSFVFLTTYGNLYSPRWLFPVRPVIKHPKSYHMKVMAVRTSNPGSKYLFLWPVIKWGLRVSLYRIINSFILVLVRKESHMFYLSLFQLCLLWEVVLPLFFG